MSWSDLVIPVFVCFIVAGGLIKRVPVYTAFIEGAVDGLKVIGRIFPYLVAMLVAIQAFEASGALTWIEKALTPLGNWLGFPGEVLPLGFLRPVSGTAAMGYMQMIFQRFGPDSTQGLTASVMMGSTETTLYTVAVYLGAVSIRKPAYAIKAGLIADMAGLIAALIVSRFFFG
jgi:spore maturation protein B